MFDIDELESCIRPLNDPHHPHSGLIVVENTHNYCGGKIVAPEFLSKVCFGLFCSFQCAWSDILFSALALLVEEEDFA